MDTHHAAHPEDQVQAEGLGLPRNAFEHVFSQAQETPERHHDENRLSRMFYFQSFVLLAAVVSVLIHVMQRSLTGVPWKTHSFIQHAVGLFNHVYRLMLDILILVTAVTRSILMTAFNVPVHLCHLVQTVTCSLCYGAQYVHSTFCERLQGDMRHVYMMFPKTEGYSDQYGTCSSKVPPSWDPAWDRQYPFHVYPPDVTLWL